ncbi:MAG: insulinase family protein [Bacteroidales bacterium]
MKKLLLLVATFALTIASNAQMPQTLPLDPKVRTGKLDNGLTYFVAKNSEPKGQAEFYIAQKVGSILEEENQRGLAHFLEHMAFNGSKNFPGNGIISYLETIGVKFGVNLNAYTAIDQTVYNISKVPVKRQGIIDSCLLILYDWSCAISLKDEDIEEERGVIREELRTRNNAQMRMLETILPEIMPDSKYAYRLPAGLVKVIDSFTPDELRAYYHKWYRPDLQGIIVVGDIDPAAVENQIKSLFNSIPLKKDAAERTEFPVPDTKEALISVASDPEATATEVSLMFKQDVLPKELRPTVASLVVDYMNNMIVSMLNSRLQEIFQKANAPFVRASASYGDFIVSNTKSVFDISANAREGEHDKALRAIVNESEKVRQFGFTASEYERARANYTSSMDKIYKEKEKQDNSFYVNQILNHFLTGNAMPGIEMEYTMMQQIAPSITIDQVNEYAKSLPKQENIAILVMMPKKDGLTIPSKDEVLSIYKNALKDSVEAYKETISNEPLVPVTPKPGKVLKETNEPISGATVWNLSNGATVVIKKTDFKEDEIAFSAQSRGGYSLFDKSDLISTKIIGNVVSLGGLGNYSVTDLQKVLAGKNVNLMRLVNTASEGLSGSSSPKDIETFMQLVYLSFTALRQDNDAYQSFVSRAKTQLQNMDADPNTALSDTLQNALFNNNPYIKRMTVDMLEKADYTRALELARTRFANAADFTFVFVGNVDPATLKPLVETYIASLPANKGKKEDWKNLGMLPVKGEVVKHFDREMQAPKASVYTIYTGKAAYTVENIIMADMMKQVFDLVFTKTIREEEGGTYGVGVNMSVNYYPEDYFTFLFGFDTDVALKEKLLKRAHLEINNVIEKGINEADFAKIVEYMQKNYTQNLRENKYWRSVLSNRYLLGKDFHTTYEASLKSMTPAKLQNFIKETIGQGNQLEVIMSGKAVEKK